MLNDSNGGGDWRARGVRRSQVEKRNEKTGTGSGKIWDYMQKIIEKNVQKGNLLEEKED